MDWKFTDPWHVAVITTWKILRSEDWIAYVFHDEDDGGWQFHGVEDSKVEDAAIVALGEMFDRDNSIGELADLPEGWEAWRESPSGPWRRRKSDIPVD
jgi:hypothetical protein